MSDKLDRILANKGVHFGAGAVASGTGLAVAGSTGTLAAGTTAAHIVTTLTAGSTAAQVATSIAGGCAALGAGPVLIIGGGIAIIALAIFSEC